jgi:hypothetical protein
LNPDVDFNEKAINVSLLLPVWTYASVTARTASLQRKKMSRKNILAWKALSLKILSLDGWPLVRSQDGPES